MTLGLNRIDLSWSLIWIVITLIWKGILSAWSLGLLLIRRYISIGLPCANIGRILIFLVFLSWWLSHIIILLRRIMWSSWLHLLHPWSLWLLDSTSSRIWPSSSWSCPWTWSVSLPWPSWNRFERIVLLLLGWLSIILRLDVLRRLLRLILILMLNLLRLSILPQLRKVLILGSNLLNLLRVQKELSSVE